MVKKKVTTKRTKKATVSVKRKGKAKSAVKANSKTKRTVHKNVKAKVKPKVKSVKEINEVDNSSMMWVIWSIVILVALAAVVLAFYSKHFFITNDGLNKSLSDNSRNKNNISLSSVSSDKMNVYVFGDYQCPFTKMEESVFERLLSDPQFKDRINLKFMQFPLVSIHHHAYQAAIAGMCAKQQGKLTQYSLALLKSNDLSVPGLEAVAKQVGLNVKQFDACVETNETEAAVNSDIALARSLGISGTPTFVFMGTVIPGAISYGNLTALLKRALAVFNGTNPSLTTPSYPAYFIEAVNCTSCNNKQMFAAAKSTFSTANFTRVDYESPLGKSLIKELNISLLPAVVVSSVFKQSFIWKTTPKINQYFEDHGKWLVLSPKVTGASYYANATLRAESKKRAEQMLNKSKKILNVKANKTQIDFFVMAFCPFGNVAENLISPNVQLFGDNVKFVPHYIVVHDSTGNFSSLHGAQELHEDVRELCAYHLYDFNSFFNFVTAVNGNCSASNADTCWKNVAKDVGLNVSKIESCYDANFTPYLQHEYNITSELGVYASPTIFLNGAKVPGPKTPQTADGYKQLICSGFSSKPSVCNLTLSKATQAAGSCGG